MDFSQVLQVLNPVLEALFVALVAYVAKVITSKIKNKDLLLSIESFAKDGVVLAEKSGAVAYLTGSEKFKQAEQHVFDELAKLGYKNVSEGTVTGKVESAFALLKDDIEQDYEQVPEPKAVEKPVETKVEAPVAQPVETKVEQPTVAKAVVAEQPAQPAQPVAQAQTK